MKPEEIREKIRVGDYQLIAEMTGYKRKTVEAQITGYRTLKPKVIEAAIKLITTRDQLLNN